MTYMIIFMIIVCSKADGKRLLADFATTERDNTNDFGIYVRNTNDGIYPFKDTCCTT